MFNLYTSPLMATCSPTYSLNNSGSTKLELGCCEAPRCEARAKREAEIGMRQINVIQPVAGADYVGPSALAPVFSRRHPGGLPLQGLDP